MTVTGYNKAQSDAIRMFSTTDEETMPREVISTANALQNQSVIFSYFVSRVGGSFNNVRTNTSSTAAGATPTYCAVGVYSVAANGGLTRLAQTANTTSLWAAGDTSYNTALTSSAVLIAGQTYAVGILCVSGAAFPTLIGGTSLGGATPNSLSPRMSAQLTGQATLPASVAAGSLSNNGRRYWTRLSA